MGAGTIKMKRFWVFAYDEYYPCGGMNDLVSCHDSLDEARSAAEQTKRDKAEVVDVQTMQVCASGEVVQSYVWEQAN